MVILDIPLLIENNLNKKDDILIFVRTKRVKFCRLKERPNFNSKVLKNLKRNQLFLTKKRKLANYIIDNNFSPNIMKNKIKLLKQKLFMKEIVLDTETTGLSVKDGHRIVKSCT